MTRTRLALFTALSLIFTPLAAQALRGSLWLRVAGYTEDYPIQ